MAKLIDQLGNEIEVGDLLHCSIPSPSVVGHVIQHTPGSTLGIKGNKNGGVEERITMGTFVLRVDIPFAYDPRDGRAGNALKVVNPTKEKKSNVQLT